MALKKNKPLTVRAVRPNVGLEREYRRKLQRLIRQMNDSVKWWLKAAYRRNEGKIELLGAEDASPAVALQKELRRLFRHWEKVFSAEGKKIAYWLVSKAKGRGQSAMKAALKAAGITVNFKPSRAEQYMMSSIIEANVALIKTIPSEYFDRVEQAVQRSVQAGRDIYGLTEELDRSYDISRKRAAVIARDQNNKATDGLNRVRDAGLGITEGIWIHVPGDKSSRHTHMQMNGKKFNLAEGMYDPAVGRNIHCGELVNCNCIYKAVIPTFDPSQGGDTDE